MTKEEAHWYWWGIDIGLGAAAVILERSIHRPHEALLQIREKAEKVAAHREQQTTVPQRKPVDDLGDTSNTDAPAANPSDVTVSG